MPLEQGTSDKTVSRNVSETMGKWEKTGSIGTSTPDTKGKAQDQAVRISLEQAGKSKYAGDWADHPPVTEIMEEWERSGRPAMGSRPIAPDQAQQIDQGMDQSHDPQPAQAAHETVNVLREDPAHYQVSGVKADPMEVAYRWADGDQQCANCLYFDSEQGSCSKVEGQIHPDAVCDLWEAVPSFHAGGQNMRNYSADDYHLAHTMFGQNFAAEKAPVGGVEVQGKFYPGGQFIPAEVVAQATEEEKAEIEGEVPADSSGQVQKPQSLSGDEMDQTGAQISGSVAIMPDGTQWDYDWQSDTWEPREQPQEIEAGPLATPVAPEAPDEGPSSYPIQQEMVRQRAEGPVPGPDAPPSEKISYMLLKNINEGMDVPEAFDDVLGAGSYDKMVSELYERARAQAQSQGMPLAPSGEESPDDDLTNERMNLTDEQLEA